MTTALTLYQSTGNAVALLDEAVDAEWPPRWLWPHIDRFCRWTRGFDIVSTLDIITGTPYVAFMFGNTPEISARLQDELKDNPIFTDATYCVYVRATDRPNPWLVYSILPWKELHDEYQRQAATADSLPIPDPSA